MLMGSLAVSTFSFDKNRERTGDVTGCLHGAARRMTFPAKAGDIPRRVFTEWCFILSTFIDSRVFFEGTHSLKSFRSDSTSDGDAPRADES